MLSRLLLLGEIDPETTGRYAGEAFFLVILLAGALKCWKISSRPTTNRKCALSLMFVLLSFTGFACGGMMLKMVHPSSGFHVLMELLRMAMFGLMMTSLVFAILGLAELAKETSRYVQGKSQAVWALIFSGLIIITTVIGLSKNIYETGENAVKQKQGQPGKLLNFADLNFRFRAPERPWVSVDMRQLNKDSKLSFMRQLPEAYFIIIAESFEDGGSMSSKQLAEIAKAHMESAAASNRIIEEAPLKVGNLDGILVEQEAQVGKFRLFYMQWFVATNGYAYQLTGYGNWDDRHRIEGELRQMMSRFELIDPNRLAAAKSHAFTTNFISPAHFYTVDVANSAWHVYSTLRENFPEAEFGGSQGDSCFVVVPVWLGGQKIDTEALAASLLGTMNIVYPNDDIGHRQNLDENGSSGLQFDYKRKVDGTLLRYRMRILQEGEFGYLAVAWTQRNEENAGLVLNDALSRVKIIASNTNNAGHLYFSEQDRKNQGYVLNQAGLVYFNSEEYEKALPLFRAAVEADSTNTVRVNNLLLTWSRLNRSKDGLDYLNTQGEKLLDKPEFRSFQAYFQSKCSRTDEAITNYAKAFSSGYRDEEDFKNYINLLIATRQYDRGMSEVEQYLRSGDSAGIRLLTADIYSGKKDYDKAVSFLKSEHAKAPYNSKTTRILVNTLLDAGLPNEALAYCTELLKDDDNSHANLYLKARCEINLKWYKEAKSSLEAASKLEPSDEDVRADLNYVSGLLGEGNNSLLKEPIDAVLLPEALTNRAAEITPKDYARDFGAYYSRCIKALTFKPHAEYRVTDYMTIEVLDATGVAAFSTFQMPFDPLSEDIFMNDGRVLDSSGKVLATVKASDCYVIDDTASGTVSHKKILNIPIAGLQAGCKVSLVITRRSSGRLEEFPFLSHNFSRSFPVLASGVFLQGNVPGLKVRLTSGITRENLKDGTYWHATQPIVARWEPMQSPADTFLPTLWVSDDTLQWVALATNYLVSINDRLQPDETLRLKAQQLAGDLKDNPSKISVLSRYVQTNCTYKAIEFGRRTRIPNKASDTLRNSYGDCKDHAVLLQQLLKCAGVPANLALVSLKEPVQTNLPSLDQFDHMIVEVQQDGRERFIDCTDKGTDLTVSLPLGLAEHQALVLDPANPHFTKLSAYPENASCIDVEQHVCILGTSDLSVDETISLTGVHGAYLRDYLQSLSPAYRQENLQSDMGMADTEMSHFEVEALGIPNRPLQIKYSFVLKNQFHQTQDGLVGKLRGGLERDYLSTVPIARRLTPFETTIPLRLRSQIVFEPPKGYHVVDKLEPTGKLNSRFITFQAQQQFEAGRLILTFQWQRPIGQYGAADYFSYQNALAQVQSSMDHEIFLQVDGQSATSGQNKDLK